MTNNKFIWEKDEICVIHNDDIECRDCIFNCQNAGICEKYDPKPLSIIEGGKCRYKETK